MSSSAAADPDAMDLCTYDSGYDSPSHGPASPTSSSRLSLNPSSDLDQPSIFLLPPEIRHQIWINLLLAPSAFRLGHQGPYSHDSVSGLHPAILRTCRAIHAEASEVLYGENTFFLGPLAHKPTYSASFIQSVGRDNTLLIRRIVAHIDHPARLTTNGLNNWLLGFGLELARLKVLALSFPKATPNLGFPFVSTIVLPAVGTLASSPGAKEAAHEDGGEKEWERMEGRMDWMRKVGKDEVEKWCAVGNTDLRAGPRWLLWVERGVERGRELH